MDHGRLQIGTKKLTIMFGTWSSANGQSKKVAADCSSAWRQLGLCYRHCTSCCVYQKIGLVTQLPEVCSNWLGKWAIPTGEILDCYSAVTMQNHDAHIHLAHGITRSPRFHRSMSTLSCQHLWCLSCSVPTGIASFDQILHKSSYTCWVLYLQRPSFQIYRPLLLYFAAFVWIPGSCLSRLFWY